MPPIINIMSRAAEAASKSLIRDFGEVEHLQVAEKSPANFVSAADTRAEEIIFKNLQKSRPDISFMMEERGFIKGEDESKIWHVDPLDGTHNFIHGIPHWCISIALEEDGEITAGLIYDPVQDEQFWAAKGAGAFMRGHRRMRVSARQDIRQSLFASCMHVRGENIPRLGELDNLVKQSMGMRRTGSTALDLAYVASGRFDAFWGLNSKSWDVAAGYIMVKEAGGYVSALNKADSPFSGKSILASTPFLHNDFKKLLEIQAKAA
jgi:myo-inositol-1(or 4)-monophosphatase